MRRILFLLLIGLMVAGGTLPAIAYRSPENSTQTATVDDLVNANNQFAFDLYDALSTEEDNLIFSPYSISMVLAMLYAGAGGNTATQIAETLHFNTVGDSLDEDFFDLQNVLNADVEAPPGIHPSELNVVNGMWTHFDFPFQQDYLDVLHTVYQAEANTVDFRNNPEAAFADINEWISRNTNGRIKDALGPDQIEKNIILILVNAIYFKGTWLNSFDPSSLEDGPFTLLDGNTVEVPMMKYDEGKNVGYFSGENFKVVDLHFQDGLVEEISREIGMMFVLPDEGAFEEVQASLDADWFESKRSQMTETRLEPVIPKFSYETKLDLIPPMRELGVTEAFDTSGGNFSRMISEDSPPVYVSKLMHRANIDVDEAGTEASAVTISFSVLLSLPPEGLEIRFDRPFIYIIYDKVSGSILFLGRVMNPTP
ncbi:MAG: serpin family protein [Chloroflexi bacterium]|nr:serpin family protein [Chloroflexota bacterium]